MYSKGLWALALSISLVNAFKDTSPFFLFSTSELQTSSPDLVSAKRLSEIVTPELTKCTSDTYVIVSQPGVEAADFRDRQSVPHLRIKMLGKDKSVRSSLAVQDVLGKYRADELSRLIQERCDAGHLRIDASTGSFAIAEDSNPRVINVDFPPLPSGPSRSEKLLENDIFLASMLDLLSSKRYTVIYTTSPPDTSTQHTEPADSQPYEMDSLFQAHLHTDLKRDLSHHKRAADSNVTLPDGPLFERYQFFNPGLFMGLVVGVILLSILYVGITGVASLQVSYAAFDKEMGPAAHKKQA
ncbi:hypothetical protein MMC21_006710 [Puttea exsequens]|nr:hypothetical protein [Puttea exsequens]